MLSEGLHNFRGKKVFSWCRQRVAVKKEYFENTQHYTAYLSGYGAYAEDKCTGKAESRDL